MRISDWSSDVCSSDLNPRPVGGSLFRIHRDTRFSNDKTPYKAWAGLRLYHQRHREVHAPSFYIKIAPGDSFVGGGKWHPDAATTRRVRNCIADKQAARSEERRVGKEGDSKLRSRWYPNQYNKTKNQNRITTRTNHNYSTIQY